MIRFGYNPPPLVKTLAEQLVRKRTTLGISRKAAATRLGVALGTLATWEQGKKEPTSHLLVRVKRLLDEEEQGRSRRAG
jgi:DNA-binding transcriptional regulator YiaG